MVLARLFESCGGEHWDCNWSVSDLSSNHCEWEGVGCSPEGDIQYLDLTGFGLSGTLPETLGCLSGLKALTLNENPALETEVPTSMSNIVGLQYLQANNAGLTGDFPECVCHLPYLQYLLLDNNSLSGDIPSCLGDLIFLRSLHACGNNLSGSVPATLDTLPFLREVRLSLVNDCLGDGEVLTCADSYELVAADYLDECAPVSPAWLHFFGRWGKDEDPLSAEEVASIISESAPHIEATFGPAGLTLVSLLAPSVVPILAGETYGPVGPMAKPEWNGMET
ncbi:vacuolar protein sorting-associated protein 62 [Kipferlia bialata]|uniref:Vacuolar protein sorting-associated protein 62 n=1 Tax=Kipferlia bialata TaxID=797122 RepID=A0A9K3CR70_9EUKA|nr:vacuolar protein sorting-associated protein 62 [Kipferlia bialata]|eukprot:g2035.t1